MTITMRFINDQDLRSKFRVWKHSLSWSINHVRNQFWRFYCFHDFEGLLNKFPSDFSNENTRDCLTFFLRDGCNQESETRFAWMHLKKHFHQHPWYNFLWIHQCRKIILMWLPYEAIQIEVLHDVEFHLDQVLNWLAHGPIVLCHTNSLKKTLSATDHCNDRFGDL